MAGNESVDLCRTRSGEVLASLRISRSGDGGCQSDFFDSAGRLLLRAIVDGPGATRASDGAGRELPLSQTDRTTLAESVQPPDPGIRPIGDGMIMISCEVDGHLAWIIDDYLNRARHIILGCSADRFLHVHLDALGATSITEKPAPRRRCALFGVRKHKQIT